MFFACFILHVRVTSLCTIYIHFINRAVRHQVEVSAPVLFMAFFLVHVPLKYASLNRMRLRPGYMSFESKQYGGQRWLELLF